NTSDRLVSYRAKSKRQRQMLRRSRTRFSRISSSPLDDGYEIFRDRSNSQVAKASRGKEAFPLELAALFPACNCQHIEIAHKPSFEVRVGPIDDIRNNELYH